MNIGQIWSQLTLPSQTQAICKEYITVPHSASTLFNKKADFALAFTNPCVDRMGSLLDRFLQNYQFPRHLRSLIRQSQDFGL